MEEHRLQADLNELKFVAALFNRVQRGWNPRLLSKRLQIRSSFRKPLPQADRLPNRQVNNGQRLTVFVELFTLPGAEGAPEQEEYQAEWPRHQREEEGDDAHPVWGAQPPALAKYPGAGEEV